MMKRYQFAKEQKALLESIQTPFAIYQFIDNRVVTLALSDGFCRLFEYQDLAEAYYDMDHNMYKYVHADDAARIANAAYRFATEGGEYDLFYRTIRKDGGCRLVHAVGRHMFTPDGVRLAHVSYTDEGDQEEGQSALAGRVEQAFSVALHENSLLKSSKYDFLTGLPSMTYFFELATASVGAQAPEENPLCLLYIDFIGMKFFNTKHGFPEGDRLLRAFGQLLGGMFHNEMCCRMGADRFAVLAREEGVKDRLHQLFDACAKLNGGKSLPIHVGIYPRRLEAVPIHTACDRARLACDALKGAYVSCFNYYSIALRNDIKSKQYIIENLDKAIEEKWIQVYYQPIIRAISEQVCDVEALARWIDPVEGFLSPAQFIPYLEEAGLIYKLDLYVLEQVLAKIRKYTLAGLPVVPHSINLSRSDFDACDIVEELRKRVDASGVPRFMISVEITESVMGGDFDFMKTQVERFQKLGFPVWMDDFGSGYSSLDVLQNIKFDLLKFDMGFMQRLDSGEAGKIILTELMKMATNLGMDTICEGVETPEQARFLQEIGCAKLQGYYYSKPVSQEVIEDRQKSGHPLVPENPKESHYFDTIGRVNLFDLAVLSNMDEHLFQHAFNTVPMGILEVNGDSARFIRSNQSYRDFVQRFFGLNLSAHGKKFANYGNPFMWNVLETCHKQEDRSFFKEKMPDGSVVHAFARRIGVNPETGNIAVAVAVLSVSSSVQETTYGDIARALASDYYNIFVVDVETEEFIEYSSPVGGQEMALERYGGHFFETIRDSADQVYEADREAFFAAFSKEKILEALEEKGVFTAVYRLIDSGVPVYAAMKATRMQADGKRVIIGVSIVDAQMKRQEEEKKLRQEKTTLGRIAALSPNFIVLYTIDAATGRYTQYNPSGEYQRLGLSRQGEDFYADVIRDMPRVSEPRDVENHLRLLTRDNMMREIREKGRFRYDYRLLLDGKPIPVSLQATLIEESNRKLVLLGVMNDEKEEYRRHLEAAYKEAHGTAVVYTRIAQALARGYTDLFYVNMETDELIEYHTDDARGVLTEERRSADFFEGCARDAKLYIHPEDQELFVRSMTREYLTDALSHSNTFEMIYRRILGERTFYVRMRVSRVEEDPRFIVIAVSDIDELIRKRQAEERIQEERIVYARLHALTGNFIVVYVVDPETGDYREFSATEEYQDSFMQAREGRDFFKKVRRVASQFNHPADLPLFLMNFTKENVMAEIERTGIFTLGYRLIMEGRPIHVQMKAAMVEEREGPRLVIGINDIDVQVRQEEEFTKRIAQAQAQANIDALTGVKNKHAYLEVEAQMDYRLALHRQAPFAIVMFDVNDLKLVNDTQGHQAGDKLLQDACKIICNVFKHSPVYRVGGDEFTAIVQGNELEHLEDRMAEIRAHNSEALASGGIVIACGMAKLENDTCAASVLNRADKNMYDNKECLKKLQRGENPCPENGSTCEQKES